MVKKITFGICVSSLQYLHTVLDSILLLGMDPVDPPYMDHSWYEILLIGSPKLEIKNHLLNYFLNPEFPDIKIIDFDETDKKGWITRKKNILTEQASGEFLVLMHDYVALDSKWLETWVKYLIVPNGKDWIGINPVHTLEGERSADWLVSPIWMEWMINRNHEKYVPMLFSVAPHENAAKYVCGLPYDKKLSKFQYVSGAYFLGPTETFRKYPQMEHLGWGDAEDVWWSDKVLHDMGVKLILNRDTVTTLLKPGKWTVTQMPDEFCGLLEKEYTKKYGIEGTQ